MKVHTRPWVVLVVAVALPGVGQVLNQQSKRGLVFVFYMLLLGALTSVVAHPERSFVGTFAGGFFVYALSIMDAYRVAVIRQQATRRGREVSASR